MRGSAVHLLGELKAARKQKKLSQEALAEKVGIPQSHLSKIEGGSVDIQTSSLIELARNLELELMLIPKQLVLAVRSIVSSHDLHSDNEIKPAYRLAEDDDA